MSLDNTIQYYKQVYNTITELYVLDRLSIPQACAKIPISIKTYYKICKRFDMPSAVTYKHKRIEYMKDEEKSEKLNSL